jgi:uncharacterized protein (TIGR02996 family)
MSTDRAALLAAIATNPDEYTPRLVYADWLDELAEGLPEEERAAVSAQAELLRVRVDLESAVEGVRDTDVLRTRARKLEARHAENWLAGVPAFARTWVRLAHGLPTRLEITGRMLLRHGKRLRREVPYTSLRLRNAAGVLEDVVNAGLLAGVHELDISFNKCSDPELLHLFRSPDLASVRDLDIAHIQFGDGVAVALARSVPLANVRRLNVWWCSPGIGRALAASKTLTHLERLQIGNAGMDVKTLTALVSSPLAAGLEDLELSYNALGAEAGAVLARSPWLMHLRRLSAWSCGLGDAGLIGLAASPHLRRLEYLGLNGNAIGVRGAGALGRSPVVASVRALAVESNGFGDEAVIALAADPAFRNLERLELGGVVSSPNRVGVRGVEALVRSPLVSGLRELDLYGSEALGAAGAAVIAGAERLARLEALDLARCELGPDGGVALAGAGHFAHLRYVRLSRNRLGSAGVTAIASAPWLATVRELRLDYNQCGASAELLLDNPHIDRLESLSLGGNRLQPASRAKFTARLGDSVQF